MQLHFFFRKIMLMGSVQIKTVKIVSGDLTNLKQVVLEVYFLLECYVFVYVNK